MGRSAIFWIFQHWIPFVAAVCAPMGLLLQQDSFGAFDLVATGALSFIGVFLIFGVALDILSSPKFSELRWYLFAFCLLGIGAILILLSGAVSAAYAFGVQMPSHLNPPHNPSADEAVGYSLASIAVYISGVAVAIYARRFLRQQGVIGGPP